MNPEGDDADEYVCVSPLPLDSKIQIAFLPIKENDDLRNLEHSRMEALKNQLIKAKLELE
jgi:hypothetical protein